MLDDTIRKQIDDLIAQHEILLFMKGNPEAPQCGFSATTVEILDFVLPDGTNYGTVNVLGSQELREGIKAYANWPTIPQLYVKGEFLGGCDIVKELFASGELYTTFGLDKPEFNAPQITITDAATEKLREALADQPGQCLSMSVDASFQNSLRFIPETEDPAADIRVESNGLAIAFDPISARRGNGLQIDYVRSEQGEGFVVDNPNAPPPVKTVTVQELKAMLDSGEKIELLDVRAPAEIETASIRGARPLNAESEEAILALDRSTPLFFVCHHGSRSADAANYFRSKSFLDISNVEGGIDAWSEQIDPSVPRY